jgi:hypothetical protein
VSPKKFKNSGIKSGYHLFSALLALGLSGEEKPSPAQRVYYVEKIKENQVI